MCLQLVNKRVEDLEQDMVKSEDQNFPADPHPEYATSAISEVYVLSSRNFKNVMRTPELFYSRCGMMVSYI